MRLHVNQIEIEVEDTGEATRPAVLLIMGLGMQLIGLSLIHISEPTRPY